MSKQDARNTALNLLIVTSASLVGTVLVIFLIIQGCFDSCIQEIGLVLLVLIIANIIEFAMLNRSVKAYTLIPGPQGKDLN